MPYKDPQTKAANGRAYYLANKERINARNKEYRLAHLEQDKNAHDKWVRDNPERSRAIKAAWKKRHPDKVAEDAKRQRENLSNWYVRKKICQVYAVKPKDIPKPLVDTHRELLKLKRELRKWKTATN